MLTLNGGPYSGETHPFPENLHKATHVHMFMKTSPLGFPATCWNFVNESFEGYNVKPDIEVYEIIGFEGYYLGDDDAFVEFQPPPETRG